MPRDYMAETLHLGEEPRTRFLDMEDAKCVTVLDYPGLADEGADMMDAQYQLRARLAFADT